MTEKSFTTALLESSRAVENMTDLGENIFTEAIERADALCLRPDNDYSNQVIWNEFYKNPPKQLREWIDFGLTSQARFVPIQEAEHTFASWPFSDLGFIPFKCNNTNKYLPHLFRIVDIEPTELSTGEYNKSYYDSKKSERKDLIDKLDKSKQKIWASFDNHGLDFCPEEIFYHVGDLNLTNEQKDFYRIDSESWLKRAYEKTFDVSVNAKKHGCKPTLDLYYSIRDKITQSLVQLNGFDPKKKYVLRDVDPEKMREEIPRGTILALRDAKESGLFQKLKFAELVENNKVVDPVLLGEFYSLDYPICYWKGD